MSLRGGHGRVGRLKASLEERVVVVVLELLRSRFQSFAKLLFILVVALFVDISSPLREL